MKFRKKPVEIEAVQMPTFNERIDEAPQWLLDAFNSNTLVFYLDEWIVTTLEDGKHSTAIHVGNPGDWLIRGVQGELYFCKPDIFEATYEAVS